MGGDCLNVGCVPSKSLIAAAAAAQAMRDRGAVRGPAGDARIDFAAVRRHVQGVIAAIAPHDSVERFERLGVTRVARARPVRRPGRGRSGRPAHPCAALRRRHRQPPGRAADARASTACPTSPTRRCSTWTELPRAPAGARRRADRLRAGAGVPAARRGGRARRLGSDPAAGRSGARRRSCAPGCWPRVCACTSGSRSWQVEPGPVLRAGGAGGPQRLPGTHLLVADRAARPKIEGLDLDSAGIAHDAKGIKVDRRLRTTNARVFAIGDVAGGLQFTHVGRLPCRHRDPQRAVPAAGAGQRRVRSRG